MFLHALTRTGKWFLYLLAGLLVLIALLTAVARIALFQNADYSERLASLVSRYIGSPVEIDKIDLVWDKFDAVANLSDVRILSADGSQTDLVLPSIELELNLGDMILARNLSVRRVQLKKLSLVADYKGRGELEILGREIGSQSKVLGTQVLQEQDSQQPETSRGSSALTWLFNAERIAIIDSSITLTDRTRNTTHRINNVDIRAFNDDDLHQIRINSALPGAIGTTSVASFDFTGAADDIRNWNGQFYLDTRQLNLGELSGVLDAQGRRIDGLADVQAWGRWRGTRINELRVLGSVSGFDMHMARDELQEPLQFEASTIEVDVDWARKEGGWNANFNRLEFGFGDGEAEQLVLNGLDLSEQRDATGVKRFYAAGPDIELQKIKPFVQLASSAADKNNPADKLLGGLVRDWVFSGELNSGSPQLTQLKADFIDVELKTAGVHFPALSASLLFKDNVGELEILPKSTLKGGELFSESMPVLNLSGNVQFTNNNNRWLFGSDDLELVNNDIKTRSSVNLTINSYGQRLMDAVSSIEYINLAKVSSYLPAKGLKPRLRKWINDSVISGDVVRGQVTVSGDLADFAPAQGKGELFGEVDVVDSTLKFRPDWPVAKQMDGNITFNAKSMRGRIYQGALREARFSDARLLISDFKVPMLEFQTSAIGPLDDMLDFAQRGPLAKKIGGFFGDATGNGASRLTLDLLIPLKRELRDQLKVDGSVLLENAQINAKGFGLDFQSVTGEVGFNRRGLILDDLLVRYQGIPLKVVAQQKQRGAKAVNSIEVKGPVAIANVLASYGIPINKEFDGISDWLVRIDITRGKPGSRAKVELTATSDLTGTQISLPIPFTKSADNIREAKVYRDFSAKEKDWWLDVPGLAQVKVRVGSDRKLESMAIALGRSNNTVLPWRGIAIHGDVGRVDTLGWYRFASGLSNKSTQSDREPFPLFAKVAVRRMQVGSENVGNGVYIAFRDGDEQVHRIENQLINGEIRTRFGGAAGEPLVLRLDSLDKQLLAALGSDTTGGMTNSSLNPVNVPPIDAIVKELKWDNWRFSRVALRTRPSESGLQITSLTARQDAVRISGSGDWINSGDGGQFTTLDINGSVDDLGKGVSALGGGDSFAGGQGEAALSLSWAGPAYQPRLQEMTGDLFLSFRDGRILGVEPGAGRILGLFALQSLPRRLTLDFRDIVKTGLEYTTINGGFSIAQGKLSSQTLLFTGPAVEILIHGNSDFINRTYDQTIDMLPRVSGALPLIGVLSGGPAAGVTALVADGILKGLGVNLDEIGRRRFTLSGSWDAPQWVAVNTQASR